MQEIDGREREGEERVALDRVPGPVSFNQKGSGIRKFEPWRAKFFLSSIGYFVLSCLPLPTFARQGQSSNGGSGGKEITRDAPKQNYDDHVFEQPTYNPWHGRLDLRPLPGAVRVGNRFLLPSNASLNAGSARVFLCQANVEISEQRADWLISSGNKCMNEGKLAEAEETFYQVYDAGYRSDKLLESLSFALQRQDKMEEALEISEELLKLYPANPFSMPHVIGCAIGCGQFDYARKMMRYAEKYRANWQGPSGEALEYHRKFLLTREIFFTWDVPAQFRAGENHLRIPMPQALPPVQTQVKYNVSGVAGYEELEDCYGTKYLYVERIAGQAIRLQGSVVMSPASVRPLFPQLKDEDPGQQFKSQLGKTEGPGVPADIDPFTHTVAELLGQLKGERTCDTVRNILIWVRDNIQYTMPCDWGSEVALRERKGNCGGIASAAVALLRAAGVPACVGRGFGAGTEQGTMAEHAIIKYYLNGIGWIDWDKNCPIGGRPTEFIRMFDQSPSDPDAPIDDILPFCRQGSCKLIREWL